MPNWRIAHRPAPDSDAVTDVEVNGATPGAAIAEVRASVGDSAQILWVKSGK